jgi:hypothetical protein
MSLVLQSSGGGSVTIAEPTTASNFTQTLPAVTGNVVIDSATQTLTNKTIEGGTVISGTAVASTSGTSIDFTSIPSWVKRITVNFSGVSTNGSSGLLLQLGDSGGVENTGYNSTGNYNGDVVISQSTAGFFVSNGAVAARTYFGNYVVSLVNFSTNAWVGNGQLIEAGFNSVYSGAGGKSLSATLDRVRITTVNGTDAFDAGTINILYE